jgi:acetyl esterase/lipase
MIRIPLIFIVLLALAQQSQADSAFEDPLYGVQTTSNITYGTGPVNNGASTENLELDLYQPVQIATPLPAVSPAIVLIHGGGFIDGDKTDLTQLAQEYTSLGYVVVSINYRLYADLPPSSSPGPADNFMPPPAGFDTFPDLTLGGNAINAAVQDADTAMAWVRNNASTYHIDPNRIGVGGVSAGAITSELVGYNNFPGQITPSVVLDFLGSMYGTQGAIKAGDPPAFMFHGDADPQVPYAGDVAVAAQLTTAGVYHEFYVGQGIGHELDTTVFNLMYGNETLLQHNIDFLANHLVPEPSSYILLVIGCLALIAAKTRRRATGKPL